MDYILADIDDDRFVADLARHDSSISIVTRGRSRLRVYLQSDRNRTRYIRSASWLHDQAYLDALADEFPGANLISPASFGIWLLHKRFGIGQDIYLRMNPSGDFRARFLRSSLYGGRCEVFRYGAHHGVWAYDINSSYSAAAYRLAFPHPSTLRYQRAASQAEALRNILTRPGASECIVSQSGLRPYLPLRALGDGGVRTIYAELCCVRGIWTHNELAAALARGATILRVDRSYIAEPAANPFRDFIAYCYERRREHAIWKVILNAVWGRFAIAPDGSGLAIWRMVPRGDRDAWRELPEEKRMVAAGARWRGIIRHHLRAYPLWNAMIQADARMRLYDLASRCDPIYCDTDAVYTADCVAFSDEIGDGLGELKARYYRRFVPGGTKLYLADRQIRAAGIKNPTADDVLDSRGTGERAHSGGETWPHYVAYAAAVPPDYVVRLPPQGWA